MRVLEGFGRLLGVLDHFLGVLNGFPIKFGVFDHFWTFLTTFEGFLHLYWGVLGTGLGRFPKKGRIWSFWVVFGVVFDHFLRVFTMKIAVFGRFFDVFWPPKNGRFLRGFWPNLQCKTPKWPQKVY
jgi:hypothetical protein